MGREKYLEQILGSLEKAIGEHVKILIIDNGAPPVISLQLNAWQSMHPESIEVIRFDQNDSRPSTFWMELHKRGIDWVVFPSDDDEFKPEIIEEFQRAVVNNPELVGFAASAMIMDETGHPTGEIVKPSITSFGSKLERIASSIHEPPFHWPALFMRISKLPSEVPNSRFAFDWWIGLQLLLAGEVGVTESIGIKYRVHPGQESFLGPLRRKYFEAQIWLLQLVQSEAFVNWLQGLNDEDRVIFWHTLLDRKPIYGDPKTSRIILAEMHRQIIAVTSSPLVNLEISSMYAFMNGVLLKGSQGKHIIGFCEVFDEFDLANIRVSPDSNVCLDTINASKLIQGQMNAKVFSISCLHSQSRHSEIIIDCKKFYPGNTYINSDLIINDITKYCESKGVFDLVLTDGEQMLINVFRKWKNRLPVSIRRLLKLLKLKHS
jgi:hypothetical protein